MDRGTRIAGLEPEGGVGPRGRGTPDEERQTKALPVELGRDVGHLVERWGDEPRQAEQVGALLADMDISAGHLAAATVTAVLLAIAAGQIDDRKRLKRCAPKVDGAAKDLMLMTVCRLCG